MGCVIYLVLDYICFSATYNFRNFGTLLLQTANLMSATSHEKGLVVFHIQHLTWQILLYLSIDK